jgi:hypothetical protein
MSSKEPIPGRCGIKTLDGYCASKPARGADHCRMHSGETAGFVSRLRRVSAAAHQEIAEALNDPGLMDVRRPLALAETVITNSPLIPSDETTRRLARRRVASQIGPDLVRLLREEAARGGDLAALAEELLTPTDADLDEARLELHEKSMRLVAMYSKRQTEAVRALEWAKVIREQALPLLMEFGLKVSRILRQYVPDDQIAAATAEVRSAVTLTIGEMAVERDKSRSK